MGPRGAVIVSAGVAFLGAGAWAIFRTQDLEAHLAAEAKAAYAERTRTTHAEPAVEGSFGAMYLAAYSDLKAGADAFNALPEPVRDGCNQVRTGKRPYSQLPSECSDALATGRHGFSDALRATHAARLELPASLQSLRAENWRSGAPTWLPLQYAAKLAGLDIRARLAGAPPRPEPAGTIVDECVDGLALSREVSQSEGLLGSMVGVAVVMLMTETCAAALDAAPAEEKQRAARSILAIRDSIRPFKDVLRDESLFAQLAFARHALTTSELEAISPAAAAMARVHPAEVNNWCRLIAALCWRTWRVQHEAWFPAMDLPRNQRALALTRVHEEEARSRIPLAGEPFGDMGPFYKRYLRGVERLELLVAAATADVLRAQNGRWPSREELVSSRPAIEELEFSASIKGEVFELTLPDTGLGDAVSIQMNADEPGPPPSELGSRQTE